MAAPFDAVLLLAFGGPQGPDDVRPFLENVLRGRRVSPERVDEVAHHYERVGGVSPLTELTLGQARALEGALAQRGLPLPVRVGMRNWHPFLADTLAEMSRGGVRRAIGILAAAQRSYSGCLQYRENVRDARAGLIRNGLSDIDVVYVGDWHEHPGFIEANADHIRHALARLPDDRRDRARLIFTAHSIPVSMARQYPYEQQLRASAARIAQAVGMSSPRSPRDPRPGSPDPHDPRPWALVYQSRSGRPGDPWLEPDICDYLKAERAAGLDAVVLCPVGFLCDHVEVLYDLDVEAADTCRESGIAMERAETVNLHPAFIGALADAVSDVWRRYATGRPLSIGSSG
jgi:ferrochelatase